MHGWYGELVPELGTTRVEPVEQVVELLEFDRTDVAAQGSGDQVTEAKTRTLTRKHNAIYTYAPLRV